jgi:hypothetical protein
LTNRRARRGPRDAAEVTVCRAVRTASATRAAPVVGTAAGAAAADRPTADLSVVAGGVALRVPAGAERTSVVERAASAALRLVSLSEDWRSAVEGDEDGDDLTAAPPASDDVAVAAAIALVLVEVALAVGLPDGEEDAADVSAAAPVLTGSSVLILDVPSDGTLARPTAWSDDESRSE